MNVGDGAKKNRFTNSLSISISFGNLGQKCTTNRWIAYAWASLLKLVYLYLWLWPFPYDECLRSLMLRLLLLLLLPVFCCCDCGCCCLSYPVFSFICWQSYWTSMEQMASSKREKWNLKCIRIVRILTRWHRNGWTNEMTGRTTTQTYIRKRLVLDTHTDTGWEWSCSEQADETLGIMTILSMKMLIKLFLKSSFFLFAPRRVSRNCGK